MKCPYCKEEMQPGAIHFDGMYKPKWIPNKKNTLSILYPFVKGIKLIDDFLDNKIECCLCTNCKKLIIDLPEQS